MSDWTASLQQASFRGLPFGVLAGNARFGRRLAIHEYPKRDTPWPEDMGRKARRFVINGFLVTNSAIYGGGDVIAQRDAMIAAAEVAGSAALVHPTFGRLTVSLEDLDVAERWDQGRYFELTFTFIEAGQKQFPTASGATGDATKAAASAAQQASAGDFASKMSALLSQVASVTSIAGSATKFAGQVEIVARDATSLVHLGSQLSGNYGRFAGGGSVTSGISGLIGNATSLTAAVTQAANGFEQVTADLGVGGSTPAAVAASATALTSSLRLACATASDGVRLLSQISSFGR